MPDASAPNEVAALKRIIEITGLLNSTLDLELDAEALGVAVAAAEAPVARAAVKLLLQHATNRFPRSA